MTSQFVWLSDSNQKSQFDLRFWLALFFLKTIYHDNLVQKWIITNYLHITNRTLKKKIKIMCIFP